MKILVHLTHGPEAPTRVVCAETEEEALGRVAEHAKAAHGLEDVSPEVVAKVRSVMRDEPAEA